MSSAGTQKTFSQSIYLLIRNDNGPVCKTAPAGMDQTARLLQPELNEGIYFITLTVRKWYYVLDRKNRWDILLDSLRFCQKKKGLKIYAWVFMINHIHLIVESPDISGFLRDFKSFTTKAMKENIIATEPNIINLFIDEPKEEIEKQPFQFWEKTNMPIKIEIMSFLEQKYEYIHYNPVRRGYVRNAEDWVYSSANPEKFLVLSEIEG